MSRPALSQGCATPTGSSAVTTTMGTAAHVYARSAMTTSATTCASQMAAFPACLAGLGSTANSLSVFLAVMNRMATAASQRSASAAQAGRAAYAMNASPTMAVAMAPAAPPGNVLVMRAGEASSVTKISTTVPTTPRARMGPRAPTVGSAVIPAPVAQATLAWTVSWSSASVTAILVAMEVAARTKRMAIAAYVPRAIMACTANIAP